MFSERLGLGTSLPCRGRPQTCSESLHARQLTGTRTKRSRVTAVASPPHKYARKEIRSQDAEASASAFSTDSVKLATGPRSQPGSHGQAQRSVQAKASNQQTLSIGSLWGSYTRSVETNPLITKACTSFFGFVVGDILAQRITDSPFSILRCLRLGTYGFVLDGPLGHQWYKLLDANLWPKESQSNKAVLAKTAADQLIWAPIMTCVFFAVLKTLEGHPELIMQTIQDKLVRTVVANYVLWPAAHFINFKFVPGEHRVLYNNCVSILWTVFLSITTHGDGDDSACYIIPSNFTEAAAYSACWLQWGKIVWTLYLSCLAHAPVINTEELLEVIDQASFLTTGILEQTLPDTWADELSRAFNAILPDLGNILPKNIPIVPPSMQEYH